MYCDEYSKKAEQTPPLFNRLCGLQIGASGAGTTLMPPPMSSLNPLFGIYDKRCTAPQSSTAISEKFPRLTQAGTSVLNNTSPTSSDKSKAMAMRARLPGLTSL